MNGSFLSAVIAAYPLLLPGAPRAFTKFKWFTFSLTVTFVFCQSVRLNVRRHQDMLPGAKVKEFQTHYKLKLWVSFSQRVKHEKEHDVKTRLSIFTQEIKTRNVNNRNECNFCFFFYHFTIYGLDTLWDKYCRLKTLTFCFSVSLESF